MWGKTFWQYFAKIEYTLLCFCKFLVSGNIQAKIQNSLDLEHHCPIVLSPMMEIFCNAYCPNMVSTRHKWLLSAGNVASMLSNFLFFLMNLNSHVWLMAALSDSIGEESRLWEPFHFLSWLRFKLERPILGTFFALGNHNYIQIMPFIKLL